MQQNNNQGNKPYSGWKDQLQALINEHNQIRIDGRVASGDTREERAKYLFKFMTDIRAMGYKVEPANIREKHIRAICAKYEADQLAASSIQTYISFLRAFCIWIKKPGMIKDIKPFFKNPEILERSYATTIDKSWEGNGIDKGKVFNEIKSQYPHIWIQLLVEDAFGLRRKESMMLRPYTAAKDGVLYVTDGTKGGKTRTIPINNEYQEEVLRLANEFVSRRAISLCNQDLTLEQNMKKFSNVMSAYGIKKKGINSLGVTAHGLRAGFAIRELEKRGLIPLIKGGKIGSLPKEEEIRIRIEVSQLLGHNRSEVMVAYGGAYTIKGLNKINQERNKQLSKNLADMQPGHAYQISLLEYETKDMQLIPAMTMERIFLGIVEVDGAPYIEVERIGDEKRHNIAVGIISEIEYGIAKAG